MISMQPMENEPEVDPKYIKDGVLSVEALLADGWTYQDFPQMLTKYWDYVLLSLGTEGKDYIKLSEADYGNGFKRGQLMLSAQARINAGEYVKNNPMPE